MVLLVLVLLERLQALAPWMLVHHGLLTTARLL
jgi:hypothetical protein